MSTYLKASLSDYQTYSLDSTQAVNSGYKLIFLIDFL